MSHDSDLQVARAVADAVLYEGYLLYPYRASSAKNRIRWQFGVLGPRGAAAAGVGEEPDMVTEILVRHGSATSLMIRLRFLQLQSRNVESVDATGEFVSVDELVVAGERWMAWDEASEHEVVVAAVHIGDDALYRRSPVLVEGSEEITELRDESGVLAGRLVRSRRPLSAIVHVRASTLTEAPEVSRLQIRVENLTKLPTPDVDAPNKADALMRSFLGAHLLLTCESGEFVSLVDPPAELVAAAQDCHQNRCWPVLAGPPGTTDVLLASPIILEDHPSLAQESAGALFDSTEIDEILTLRILTMTDEEKAEARATDPRAAQIIDRSEGLSTDDMARLHGVLRDPHALDAQVLDPRALDAQVLDPRELDDAIPVWSTLPESNGESQAVPIGERGAMLNGKGELNGNGEQAASTIGGPWDTSSDVPWWDPERDASVDPGNDTVMVRGQAVGRGSFVRIHPNRRADAQDIFFADQRAKVTGVHFDVDGETHVGVVLVDDPAAEVNEWYGRFLYFAPDELEPIEPVVVPEVQWKES